MRELLKHRPSPALVIAVVALVAALAGTAVAEVATTSKNPVFNKKKRDKIKNLADKRIVRAEPDLSVKSAESSNTATTATNATNAANADQLDGLEANSLIRVAGDSSNDLPDSDGDALTAQITAPRSGFLHIVGSVHLFNATTTTGTQANCRLELDGSAVVGSFRVVDPNGDLTDSAGGTIDNVNTQEPCATNGVVAVSAGIHVVDLNLTSLGGSFVDQGALNVLFVPFDGSGN